MEEVEQDGVDGVLTRSRAAKKVKVGEARETKNLNVRTSSRISAKITTNQKRCYPCKDYEASCSGNQGKHADVEKGRDGVNKKQSASAHKKRIVANQESVTVNKKRDPKRVNKKSAAVEGRVVVKNGCVVKVQRVDGSESVPPRIGLLYIPEVDSPASRAASPASRAASPASRAASPARDIIPLNPDRAETPMPDFDFQFTFGGASRPATPAPIKYIRQQEEASTFRDNQETVPGEEALPSHDFLPQVQPIHLQDQESFPKRPVRLQELAITKYNRVFFERLNQFNKERGFAATESMVDLHSLYIRVTRLGGFSKVNEKQAWDRVGEEVDLTDINALKELYKSQLLRFENEFGCSWLYPRTRNPETGAALLPGVQQLKQLRVEDIPLLPGPPGTQLRVGHIPSPPGPPPPMPTAQVQSSRESSKDRGKHGSKNIRKPSSRDHGSRGHSDHGSRDRRSSRGHSDHGSRDHGSRNRSDSRSHSDSRGRSDSRDRNGSRSHSEHRSTDESLNYLTPAQRKNAKRRLRQDRFKDYEDYLKEMGY